MEVLLLAMVFGWVVKNGVKDLVHTGATAICAVQGKPAPSWGSPRRMKRPNGAATRYFRELWNDSWDDALKRHQARHARRDAAGPGDAGGAARSFFAGNFRGGLRLMHRKWDATWVRRKIIRKLKQRGTSPGGQTVPGEVVPEPPVPDPAVPADPEPVLRDQPDGGTDLQFGTDPTDPTGTRSCSGCGGALVVDGEICGECQYRQQQRNEYHDQQQDEYRDGEISRGAEDLLRRLEDMNQDTTGRQANPTQEGTPTMTAMPTAEVVGLDQAISYCEASAVAHREQIVVIERTRAALDMGDVSGPAAGFLAQAMEANATCQTAMENAATELRKQKAIQEQYDAVQGAGTREFITGGR
jgi:hypothetical protein